MNGDGYDDLLIGAPGAGGSAGDTYLIFGDELANLDTLGGSAADGVIEISALQGTTAATGYGYIINGTDGGDRSGASVSSVGDVNNDGFGDLLIGAYRADSGAGEAYLVFSNQLANLDSDSDGVIDLSALQGTGAATGYGYIINGIDVGDWSGRSVSSAGDVNGDGRDDLLIGADRADPGSPSKSNAGETYLIFSNQLANLDASDGTGDGSIDLSRLNGTTGYVINGIDEDDVSGFSVSSIGDLNNDGKDDLLIGAPLADPNGNANSGEIYLIFSNQLAALDGNGDGVIDLTATALTGANGTGYIINGIEESDVSGVSVSSAGDVNNDGYDDLLIGAYGADSGAGEAYLIFGDELVALDTAGGGTADGVIDLSATALNGTTGYVLNGIDASDRSGRSVSSAGDVNGDGVDDLLIGAYLADPNGNGMAGETYLLFGDQLANLDDATATSRDGVIDLSDLSGSTNGYGYILNGINTPSYSGFSVSSAGDVNNDGYDDLLIGAHEANGSAGETYMIFGGDAAHWKEFDTANSTTQDGVLELSLIA